MSIRTALVFFLFLAASLQPAGAQSISLFDDCNPLIKAIRPYLFVIRAEYALEDKEGNVFGQKGEEYFGVAYGPAVNIGGDLWVSKSTVQPYLTDTSYRAYGDDYQPVTSHVFYKQLSDKDMTSMPEGINNENPMCFSFFEKDGLRASENRADSSACVVISFRKIGNGEPDQSAYRLSYLNTGVKWEGSLGQLANTNLGESDFALLFYEMTEAGRVEYQFAGFVEKVEDRWTAIRFNEANERKTGPAGLTPVKNHMKRKKKP